jgi:hypothetical protein
LEQRKAFVHRNFTPDKKYQYLCESFVEYAKGMFCK